MAVSSQRFPTDAVGALQSARWLRWLLAQDIAVRRCIEMYITWDTIITAAAVLAALGTIGGLILKVHKWYLKQEEQDKEIARIKEEDRILCEGLAAALDGLEQLGANSVVTKTKKKLNDHLNIQAHE